jgi:hypothetical protein
MSGAVRCAERWDAELEKCVLLCANCHRERHAADVAETTSGTEIHPVVKWRRKLKQRAVLESGGRCERCGYSKLTAALEFHHREPRTKEFSIAHDGLTRSWSRVKKELRKCALLCANCHREEHSADPSGQA